MRFIGWTQLNIHFLSITTNTHLLNYDDYYLSFTYVNVVEHTLRRTRMIRRTPIQIHIGHCIPRRRGTNPKVLIGHLVHPTEARVIIRWQRARVAGIIGCAQKGRRVGFAWGVGCSEFGATLEGAFARFGATEPRHAGFLGYAAHCCLTKTRWFLFFKENS